MSSLRLYAPACKPGRPSPDACTRCRGTCQVDGETCDACDGTGRVRVVEGYRDPASVTEYIALTLAGVLDTGRRLEPFVLSVFRAFPDSDSDILIVKREGGPDGPSRLVCVLRPTVNGLKAQWV